MVFPVVMYGCESWTVKKAERRRIDAFELWCWRRLLRVPWTVRRLSQGCHPTILSSVFPFSSHLQSFPVSGFSQESVLCMRWPKDWSFSFNISPSNEHPGLIFFTMDWMDLLAVKGLSRVFSNTTVQKHQFLGAQLSLQSNSHIHT